MRSLVLPYSGHLLVGHLAAYGLATVLADAGHAAWVHHDPDSTAFEPCVRTAASADSVAAAVRTSAHGAESAVEADLVEGATGNDRRSVIWARGSFQKDLEQADLALGRRGNLVRAAEADDQRLVLDLLGGLGATAAWGRHTQDGAPKPAQGATALDGVLGNNTSDLIRSVLRPGRRAAAEATVSNTVDRWAGRGRPDSLDKTGWAPSGTYVDPTDQWLATLGLRLFPVVHHWLRSSETPAFSTGTRARPSELRLPVLESCASVPRLRAIIGNPALARADVADDTAHLAPLRRYGVREVVRFPREFRGGTSSVAFVFGRGTLVPVP